MFAFTDSTPDSVARATRIARPPSRVQIEPESPYGVSLEMRIASASSSKGMTAATGPNTSSRATRSSFVAFGPPAYPGDAYVDVIGLDLYHRPSDGATLDESGFEEDFGVVLRAHHDFATEHGKPVSYPEWGMRGVDDPTFIREMHAWLASLPASGPGHLLYHSYFSTARGYELDLYPEAQATFQRLFGR